jgi:uncharacterized protein YcnI
VLLALVAAALLVAAPAGAHGTLAPSAVAAGVPQRFELTVPNARLDADIVAIALELPPGAALESAEAAQPRWAVTSDDSSVRWSGGPIDRGSAETFAFTARLGEAGPGEFLLVETYDDGETPPFPITVVATGSAGSADGSDGSDGTLAAVAVVLAALALVVSTVALAVALGRRSNSPRS